MELKYHATSIDCESQQSRSAVTASPVTDITRTSTESDPISSLMDPAITNKSGQSRIMANKACLYFLAFAISMLLFYGWSNPFFIPTVLIITIGCYLQGSFKLCNVNKVGLLDNA